MKLRNQLVMLLAVSSLFISCQDLNKLLQFDMPFEEQVTIPAFTLINQPFDLTTPQIPTNYKNSFDEKGTSKELIESILLKKLTLSLLSPQSGDLDFLKNLEIFILAANLPESKVAWKDVGTMAGVKLLQLELGDSNLKNYITSDWFSLRLHSLNDQDVTVDQVIKVASIFRIQGNAF